MEIDRNLYLTAGKDRVVEEGDSDAVWLLAGPGGFVDDDYLAELGYQQRAAESSKPRPKRKTKES